MPTGYTAPVEDGEITELKDFAANCARAFGAFIHQRDDGSTVALTYPEPPTDDDYEHRGLVEAREKLKNWLKSSEEDKYREWSEAEAEREKNRQESEARNAELNARYDAMLAQVEAVAVPEELQNFKDFMVEQLEMSKYKGYPGLYAPAQYVAWCEDHESYLRRSLRLRQEGVDRDEENYRDRVEYINLMRDTYGFEVRER